MEERQVTIEGETLKLERPFFVMATQNPIEYEGTYPLPEAQLDRFLLRLSVGYPKTLEDEVAILEARVRWKKDDPTVDLNPVIGREMFLEMHRTVEESVYVSRPVLRYIAELVRNARADGRVEAGSSPRGALALLKVAKASAAMDGRDFVIPDDVKKFAFEALSHRVVIKAEYSFEGITGREVVEKALQATHVPKESEK